LLEIQKHWEGATMLLVSNKPEEKEKIQYKKTQSRGD
jgi:hypothetical protein